MGIGKGTTLPLDHFLLIRGVELFCSSLIFAVEISHFFLFLPCVQLLNKLQLIGTNNPTLGAVAFIYPLESPQKLSVALKIMPLPEHEANHSDMLRSGPICPHLGLKQKHSYVSVFLKKPKLSLYTMPEDHFQPKAIALVHENMLQDRY